MHRQLAVITLVAAAVGGGALAIGSATQPATSTTADRPAVGAAPVQAAPARLAPAIPTIEIDPYYVPQQMNFP